MGGTPPTCHTHYIWPLPADFDWSVGNDFLVSASSDGTTCLWDPVSGTCLRQLSEGGVERVLCCRFHPNNNNLVVVSSALYLGGVSCVYKVLHGMPCVYMLQHGIVLCVYVTDPVQCDINSYLQYCIHRIFIINSWCMKTS